MVAKLRILASLAVVVLVAAACQEGAPEQPAEEGDGGPIILGGAFSRAGFLAPYDQPPRQGALLAVEHINSEGGVLGRELQIVESDSRSDPAVAGQAAIELLNQGAVGLIAPCDFDVGAPVGLEGQNAGVPVISTCATSPSFPDAVGDMMFLAAFGNPAQSALAAEWAFNDQGWDTAYLVTDRSIDYTRSLAEAFRVRYEELGGNLIGTDTYQFGDEDFSSQIENIQGLGEQPDFLYISTLVPDIGTILRQLRAAGIDLPVVGGDGYEADLLVEVAGPDAANNTFFTTHGFVQPGEAEDVDLFIDLYQEEHGSPPETSFHAIGWDTVELFRLAIEEAGSTDGEAIRDALENLQEVDLLTGTLSYSPEDHVPRKTVFLIEVVDGEFQLVEERLPEQVPAVE